MAETSADQVFEESNCHAGMIILNRPRQLNALSESMVVTDNAASFVAAGRILMASYPTIYWTPCAAHCLDLLLEDIGKINWISTVVRRAKIICKFIYMNSHVRHLFLEFSKGVEIVRPATTRFATNFILLESIQSHKSNLMNMFVSEKYRNDERFARARRLPMGKVAKRAIWDETQFWHGVRNCILISKIHALYSRWESDDNTNVVIIKGTGRAFCSGGDVLSVCQLGNAGQYHMAAKYFWDEYIMNYILATYCKPHVAFLNGIVMGGGAGISMHGRFRVATENTIFAMPETGLGLHPDVGASYFLSRLPGHFGEYVGLTGMRLNGVELFTCGLATHYVSSKHLRLLEERLSKVKAPDPEVVSSLIDACSENVCLNHDSALYRMDLIERCFSKETVEDILLGLELEATTVADQWLQSAIHSIKKASPISLKITLRSIREGRSQKLHECLIREYRMSYHCVYRKVSNDFYEGCRSILLDKDKNPKWNPSKLHDVSQEMVDHYFSPVGDDLTDLHLPTSERETRNHSPLKSKL